MHWITKQRKRKKTDIALSLSFRRSGSSGTQRSRTCAAMSKEQPLSQAFIGHQPVATEGGESPLCTGKSHRPGCEPHAESDVTNKGQNIEMQSLCQKSFCFRAPILPRTSAKERQKPPDRSSPHTLPGPCFRWRGRARRHLERWPSRDRKRGGVR
jgi:hypothetical protein